MCTILCQNAVACTMPFSLPTRIVSYALATSNSFPLNQRFGRRSFDHTRQPFYGVFSGSQTAEFTSAGQLHHLIYPMRERYCSVEAHCNANGLDRDSRIDTTHSQRDTTTPPRPRVRTMFASPIIDGSARRLRSIAFTTWLSEATLSSSGQGVHLNNWPLLPGDSTRRISRNLHFHHRGRSINLARWHPYYY